MATYQSADGHWQVQVVSVDGHQRVRVDHDTVYLDANHVVPVIQFKDDERVASTLKTAFGYRVAEAGNLAVVSKYVDLATLSEV